MSGRWPFTPEKIAARLKLIEPLVHRRRQPLPHFRLLPLPAATLDAPICADPSGWQEVPAESYWGEADLNFVMKSSFRVPTGWDADRIVLHLPLGVLGDIFNHPEALVYIDQRPIGSADRYHHTLALDPALADGREHTIALHGWTGHTAWPPDPTSKAKLFMGKPALAERDPELLAFVRLAKTALDSASVLNDTQPEKAALLAALDTAMRQLDTRDPLGEAFYDGVPAAHATLADGIAAAGAPLDVTLHGIGHAHMDIAYLWPIAQARLKNARTYTNVLRLMEQDPAFRFSHSQPQLYALAERDYPALFSKIKARVAEGRWEVMGGMWVEPDLNIAGAEALVRQLTLGRTYFRDTFGDVETPVLWLPDSFGFPGQIPQLMTQAGLKWFVTNKLNWNQLNKVPWSTHRWEGIDGSRVLAHVLSTPRDVQYLPFPTNYKSDLTAKEVHGTWTQARVQDQVRDLPICFGYGDGGGGPTEDLLAAAHAYASMPGMPRLRMSTVREALEAIEAQPGDLPVWTGEHYLEGHRGVYTSQGWIKRANRKAEWALHEAEALSAMAGLKPDLTEAWRLLCLNQFHDIITGTAVPEVFADARKDFDRIFKLVEAAATDAARALGGPGPVVLNTAPIASPRVALAENALGRAGQVTANGVLHYFDILPSYSVTPLAHATEPPGGLHASLEGDGAVLENDHVRVEIARNGQFTSIFDKVLGREVLAPGQTGNQLQTFEDRPICWDAWDIDPGFEDTIDVIDEAAAPEVIETGPVRAAVRTTVRWRSSTIEQTIRLHAHSKRIDIDTRVDWHETHILLKAAFPTAINAPAAMFDIQWGTIDRATTRDTDFDAARFEVPAQKWALIDGEDQSVALLNDCKYGYDVLGGTLRLSLIKSATSPDPGADQGPHRFVYSLLPMSAGERDLLDQAAYDLNAPLRVVESSGGTNTAPSCFVQTSTPGVIIETLKPADDGNAVILRLFEAHGRPVMAVFECAQACRRIERCDLFEQPLGRLTPDGRCFEFALGRFEIATLKLTFCE